MFVFPNSEDTDHAFTIDVNQTVLLFIDLEDTI